MADAIHVPADLASEDEPDDISFAVSKRELFDSDHTKDTQIKR